mgnify:CR=1 FL=1
MGGFYNYEGSMKGSGIDSMPWNGVIYCPDCKSHQEVEGQTDDWGNYAYADCPSCERELVEDISMYGNDDDARYDEWKDSQLED